MNDPTILVPQDLLIATYKLIRSEWEGCLSSSKGVQIYKEIGKLLQNAGIDTESLIID